MKHKFTPSINIQRDINKNINYIPTDNTTLIFNQIIKDFSSGIHAFSIIGNYGTGKSSFLLALSENINNKQSYFTKNTIHIDDLQSFEILSIVGEYDSIIEKFADIFKIEKKNYKTQDVINAINHFNEPLNKKKQGLIILIDEFGKFLEFAAKNNPEHELYFIQQLSEYVAEHNILLITTLHQDFNTYSFDLSKSQRQEWDKVKGRLKEITFNEPVEQLLYLASEKLENTLVTKHQDQYFLPLFKCIKESKLFPLKDYFNEEFARKLVPFDILSASVLTLALQKYGQNERSLFSFIESNDYLGIKDYDDKGNIYYNLSCVYDYLRHNYYAFITSKYNPHYVYWSAINNAIDKIENELDSQIVDALKLIKTIGLLNIFAKSGTKIDFNFLRNYSTYSLGINNPNKLIALLEKHKIIRYSKYNTRYILTESTDLDIELAINEASHLVDQVSNVVNYINEYFEFPFTLAKANFYNTGTPRFFAFKITDTPLSSILTTDIDGYIDGYINLIFSDTLDDKDIKSISEKSDVPILYGLYKNYHEIKDIIFEIEKIKKVQESNINDKIAIKELDIILQHQIKLLNHHVTESLYAKNSFIIWYFQGKKELISSRKELNQILSQICNQVYPDTPIFKNELINKTKISSQIATARKNLLKAMAENWDKKDLGFPDDKFPPEKSIYLTLLKETKIHKLINNSYILNEPVDKSFRPLWAAGVEFLESTKNNKRNLSEFIEILSNKPFKLKQGFLDFWILIFLFIKRDDFALFDDSGYIPYLTEDILDLIIRNPSDYSIKAFDIDGVKLDIFNKYRVLLAQSQEKKLSNQSFIESIKPFLVFYKTLPEYTKKTKRLTKEALALRNAIALSKDPELTFFDEFPMALGVNLNKIKNNDKELHGYINKLQNSIKEIRLCYDDLLNRLEEFFVNEIIGEIVSFPEYKIRLQNRFKKIKQYVLLPHQKILYQRIFSELDDRSAWLNSIAQACIGKSLETINDDDEKLLYKEIKDLIYELDNLSDIIKEDIDNTKEEVLKLEITSLLEGLKKNIVRFPKNRNNEIINLEKILKTQLTDDKNLNIITLTRLLEKQLKNDKKD